MESFAEQIYSQNEGIELSIYESEKIYHGGDQHWFPGKMHQLSGCGPVAAANIAAYLSKTFPDKYEKLYPYKGILLKKDFIEHMIEVRKFVIPGSRGLTCVNQFSENMLSFSQSRGVSLSPYILDENARTMQEAVSFISQALSLKLPVAILVLKHPAVELDEYTWHWMTITNLRLNPENGKYYISVSTYGECHEIDFDLLWNNRGPEHIIRLAYFV